MQKNYKFFLITVFVGLGLFSGNVFSQGNDACGGAIDISASFDAAFASPCNYVVDGPYTNRGATVDADAAEFDEAWVATTGSMSCCACESENSGDLDVNNPVWFEFTPANTGDYSVWALGDESSQNGCSAEFSVQGDDDTQFWIFTGECGDLTLYDCNEDASNALFFEAGAVFNFTAGTKYYLVVDGYLGSQGEFCIEVASDTGDCVNCGDEICGLGFGETYCGCDSECPCDLLNGFFIQNAGGGAFNFTILGTAEVAFCPDYLSGLLGRAVDPGFTYLGFGFVDVVDLDEDGTAGDCANNAIDSVTVNYDIGTLSIPNIIDFDSGADNVPTGSLLFFKLTDDEIANNAGISLDICLPDNGNGSQCCVPKFVTFDPVLTPGVTDPSCPCAAGTIPMSEVTACKGGQIELMTNGDERLEIECPSDDGSGFQYAWRILADPYNNGSFSAVTNWKPYGSNATIDVDEFFVDEIGSFPYDFTPDIPIPLTDLNGEPTKLRIEGGSVCFNSNGNLAVQCTGLTANPEGNFITVTYLAADDEACESCPDGQVADCAGECGGSAVEDCAGVCGGDAVEDCAGDCGGTAIAGSPCDDGDPNTSDDVYLDNCTCAGTGMEDSDECITAVNISAAFSEECEMSGPYEQGEATTGTAEPPIPSCFNDGYDGNTWYSFMVPDDIAGGNPTDYIISTGAFADCTSNPLEGNSDTQIAIYEGPDCPGGSSQPIACNDDYSNIPPYVSSVQVTLTPGNPYYVMVETFGGNLSGEFCFYIQPLADFLGGGTKDCTNCGDDVCNGVVGESFAACPSDCPCDAGVASYNFIDGIPNQSLNYEAFCAEDVGATGGGLYIPFSITSTNVPMGPDDITFLNSTLTVTVGSIMNYTFGGAPTPATGDATQNVTLIYLTADDIDAVLGGAQIVLNFVDESGECNIAEPVDVTLDPSLCVSDIEGCMDATACNYNEDATIDDGSCNVPDGACEACDGPNVVVQDADGDGICDDDEIVGCMDDTACNFVPDATDPADCDFPPTNFNCDGDCIVDVDCNGDCGGTATLDCEDVCGGPAVAGESCDNNGEAGTYNGSCECVAIEVLGCTDSEACNFEPTANTPDDSCLYDDCEGNCGGDAVPGTECTDVNGNTNTYTDDCSCPEAPVLGCTDMTACNFDADANTLDDSCLFDDCEGNCGGDVGPGSECTDANGNTSAYAMDCSCPDAPPVVVEGCTDPDACNFDAEANTPDGSCIVVAAGSITLADGSLETQICVDDDVVELVDIAVVDAGQGPNGAWVITDSDANILALPGDPPFDLEGAGGGTCLIWWLTFNDDLAGAEVGANAGDLTGCFALSNSLTVNRLENCGGGNPGCTDADACNFDPDATEPDGSCQYNDCAGDCGGAAGSGTECTENGEIGSYNDDCDCIVPVDPTGTEGCTDPDACNFDPDATDDDDSCEYNDCEGNCGGTAVVGADCDDGDPDTTGDSYNADCECEGFNGTCMSQAGNLTLVEGGAYGGMNYICDGDCATVSAGDFLLDPGQGVKIVWHTDGEIGAGNFPPVNILGSGSFYCNEDGIKQTVYATAFGATKDADDEIDYSDYCLTFSNTIAITFLSPITISVDVQCDNSNGNFTYTFSVDGGLPECAPSESYSVTGDYFNGDIAPGETQSVGPIADGSSYSMTVTDPNGCEATYDDDVTCTKLPIVLELFTGNAINQGNLVKWVTSTEINNDYFNLQASTNGVNFRTIATIAGEGNSNTPIAYEHLDRAAAKGTTYYRLIQTDYDGTQSKSHVIDVSRGETAFNITDLYPIPTSDLITLQFVAPQQSEINIEVFDLIGHTLLEYQRTADGGITQMDINVEHLPAGVYFVSIISNDDKVTQKFVIE